MDTRFYFDDFKYLGKDGCFEVFQVTEIKIKKHWFRGDKLTKTKLLFESIPFNETGSNIKKVYRNISYFGTDTFLNKNTEYDKTLKNYIHTGILFMKLGIDQP